MSMNLLNTLIRAADEEQLSLRPLSQHAAAVQAEHLRRHYALLLAAVLTAQSAVSEPQTRLLRLLLDALKLGDIRGSLFEQTRELSPDQLLDAARLIREAGFAHHLVVDVLVLLRLDGPLGDEATRLAGELASFLGLDEIALAQRAADAVDILGLNSTIATHSEKEYEGTEGAAHGSPLLAELWPGLLRQSLTADALRAGLQGGLWLLDANLDVDFPWQANSAVLVFRNGATLNTFAKEGDVKLIDCRLNNAALDFQGACSVTVERCDWKGIYDPAEHRSVLKSNGQALIVTDCQFSTRNARAILVENNALTLTGSRFTHCGNAELKGGAVFHSDHARVIKDCCFDRCLAECGGAVYTYRLGNVVKCEFIACQSILLQDRSAGNVAVCAFEVSPDAISDCVFRNASLVIGDVKNKVGQSFVLRSQFELGSVYYHNAWISSSICSDCSFSNGGQFNKNLMS